MSAAAGHRYAWWQYIVYLPPTLLLLAILILILGLFGPMFLFIFPVTAITFLFDPGNEERKKLTFPQALGRAIWVSTMGSAIVLGFLAPFRTPLVWLVQHVELEQGARDVIYGSTGIGLVNLAMGIFGVIMGLLLPYLRWRQSGTVLRQIQNLPTARIHSVALGLTELTGTVRRVSGLKSEDIVLEEKDPEGIRMDNKAVLFDGSSVGSHLRKKEPFWLEDDTGRILVDPREGEFWDGGGDFFWRPNRAIHLSRHRRKNPRKGVLYEAALNPGDSIYLIGNAEPNPDAPPDAAGSAGLVIRPRTHPVSASRVIDAILLRNPADSGDGVWDLFYLSDQNETKVLSALRRSRILVWPFGLFWTVTSAPLIWFEAPLLQRIFSSL